MFLPALKFLPGKPLNYANRSMAYDFTMNRRLELVWNNPLPRPASHHDPGMLHLLADVLAGSIRCGYIDGAREMASIHHLSPLATSIVATRMHRSGISEEEILKVV